MTVGQLEIPMEAIRDFCRRWKVVEFALFGSVLRDDFGPDSDVDVLVKLAPDAERDLLDWATMIDELKTLFGRDVDLVSRNALRNPFRRHEILRTARVIYAA